MTVNTLSLTPSQAPTPNKAVPMASALLVYNDDQSVAWDRMWDSFCVLASAGGPPHRAVLLNPGVADDPTSATYQSAVAEIVRGIRLVSGLSAQAAEPGWIAIECALPSQARWLAEQIMQENVSARYAGARLYVPVGAHFTVKGEIKNVVTAVAKTTHYWQEHLAAEVKQSLVWEERLAAAGAQIRKWLRWGKSVPLALPKHKAAPVQLAPFDDGNGISKGDLLDSVADLFPKGCLNASATVGIEEFAAQVDPQPSGFTRCTIPTGPQVTVGDGEDADVGAVLDA